MRKISNTALSLICSASNEKRYISDKTNCTKLHYSFSGRWHFKLEVVGRHCWNYISRFIHNSSLQSFSQEYGLASHTTHVVCVNFIHEWRDLRFNINLEWQIFEKLFHSRFILLSEFLPQICWGENADEFFFSNFVLMSDLEHDPEFYV